MSGAGGGADDRDQLRRLLSTLTPARARRRGAALLPRRLAGRDRRGARRVDRHRRRHHVAGAGQAARRPRSLRAAPAHRARVRPRRPRPPRPPPDRRPAHDHHPRGTSATCSPRSPTTSASPTSTLIVRDGGQRARRRRGLVAGGLVCGLGGRVLAGGTVVLRELPLGGSGSSGGGTGRGAGPWLQSCPEGRGPRPRMRAGSVAEIRAQVRDYFGGAGPDPGGGHLRPGGAGRRHRARRASQRRRLGLDAVVAEPASTWGWTPRPSCWWRTPRWARRRRRTRCGVRRRPRGLRRAARGRRRGRHRAGLGGTEKSGWGVRRGVAGVVRARTTPTAAP